MTKTLLILDMKLYRNQVESYTTMDNSVSGILEPMAYDAIPGYLKLRVLTNTSNRTNMVSWEDTNKHKKSLLT